MRSLVLSLVVLGAALPARAQVVIQQQGGPGGGRQQRMTLGGTSPVFEESPAEYGVHAWRVGQFARYSITTNMGPMPLSQYHQVSIVGQQGDRFWVEIQDEFGGMMASRAPIQKMLIPFGVVRERVGTDIIVMSPDSAIYRRTLVRAGTGTPESIGFPTGWTRVGEESVTVVGGTFRAMHYRRGTDNLWVSADSGPLGVVKYESDNVIVELTGKGENARSRIPYGG